jgi:hypothetical protein
MLASVVCRRVRTGAVTTGIYSGTSVCRKTEGGGPAEFGHLGSRLFGSLGSTLTLLGRQRESTHPCLALRNDWRLEHDDFGTMGGLASNLAVRKKGGGGIQRSWLC